MSVVFHVQGFATDGEVRGVHVAQHEGTVIEVARGVIERAVDNEQTERVSFRRTWPIDDMTEGAVRQVDAVTRTTLDHGETWTEMWHWFGTLSEPWPVSTSIHSRQENK